ncbi:MAG: CCA tRNA nucleotidyltransferase [Thermoplasmata archaeon]
MDILNSVLQKIKPTEDEQRILLNISNNVIDLIKNRLHGIDAEPLIVGSVAKGTNLKNTDVDIFIRFSTSYERSFIERKALEIGKEILEDPVVNYAEHPYVKGRFNGIIFEVVPCYRVDESTRKITSVDRTPFHTEFIVRNLKEWQRDEVRLLKQFLKGIGVYGAEAKVEGFSGYLTELLILRYGSFMDVIKNSQRWKRKTVLSLTTVDYDFDSPLVFIDPVDPKRNVASAVSLNSYSMFIYASREFLRRQDERFFFPNDYPELDPVVLKNREVKLLHLWMQKPPTVDDILYPQLKKFSRFILENLQDFSITRIHYYVDDSVHLLIESYHQDLPPYTMHEGPPVWDRNAENFLKKWKGRAYNGPYIMDGKFYADVERKARSIEDAIKRLISSGSIGKDLDRLKDTIKFSRDPYTANRKELSKFLDYRFPWEL